MNTNSPITRLSTWCITKACDNSFDSIKLALIGTPNQLLGDSITKKLMTRGQPRHTSNLVEITTLALVEQLAKCNNCNNHVPSQVFLTPIFCISAASNKIPKTLKLSYVRTILHQTIDSPLALFKTTLEMAVECWAAISGNALKQFLKVKLILAIVTIFKFHNYRFARSSSLWKNTGVHKGVAIP